MLLRYFDLLPVGGGSVGASLVAAACLGASVGCCRGMVAAGACLGGCCWRPWWALLVAVRAWVRAGAGVRACVGAGAGVWAGWRWRACVLVGAGWPCCRSLVAVLLVGVRAAGGVPRISFSPTLWCVVLLVPYICSTFDLYEVSRVPLFLTPPPLKNLRGSFFWTPPSLNFWGIFYFRNRNLYSVLSIRLAISSI